MRACYYIVPFLLHSDVEYVCFLNLPPSLVYLVQSLFM